jgi:molecular chaperone GrpE
LRSPDDQPIPDEPATDAAQHSEAEAPEPTEAPPAPATPAAEPSGLLPLPPTLEDLESLRKEKNAIQEQLLRKAAEHENYKKRVGRERQAFGIETAAGILAALLPSLDNLERALGAADGDCDALREGVELTKRELLTALEAEGLECLDPAGARFDPQVHQALVYEPAPGVEEGMIVEVFRKGYRFKERLLRPALVKVARRADDDAAQEESLH